jgi:leucyl-tRNA synthetase
MSLYNHAAVWDKQPELWPRGFFTNGALVFYIIHEQQL